MSCLDVLHESVDTEGEVAALASLLLGADEGVLAFIRETRDPDNGQQRSKCREVILKALGEFVRRARRHMTDGNVLEAWRVCYAAYGSDQTNSVKCQYGRTSRKSTGTCSTISSNRFVMRTPSSSVTASASSAPLAAFQPGSYSRRRSRSKSAT